MRNGTNAVFAEGEADEVALYTRALSASEVRGHYDTARNLAAATAPALTADEPPAAPTAEPPLAGSGRTGGVLGSGSPGGAAPAPTGAVFVRRGTLVARGAARVRNDLVARRQGRSWIVRDRLAPLDAGSGCRRLSVRAVSCPAARVKRVALYGGAGNDRLTVIGRVRVLFRGGPGRDVTRARR
jgi:hypothetical protein